MADHIILNPDVKRDAAEYLSAHDSRLRAVIMSAGLCTMTPHTNYYQALGDSIIGQQLSVKAATTIRQRFCDLFGGSFPNPTAILTKSVDELRTAGLSRAKATYIVDLAHHIIEGRLSFDGIEQLSNNQIIAMLTDVKGIGIWTVHMFLMFCMGRADVLATGDLGIRSGVQRLYALDHLPSPQEVEAIATEHQWHPYESVACWYIWHSLDNEPVAV